MIEQRTCDKAAAGADALRRFVERTRGIYALYYPDFARDDERSANATAMVVSKAPAATEPGKL